MAQEWMSKNFKPEKGLWNKNNMYTELGRAHIQINAVQVDEVYAIQAYNKSQGKERSNKDTVESQQDYRITEIEDITDKEGDNPSAFVRTILVNQIPIGHSCCPYEILKVKVETGIFPVTHP